MNQGHWSDGANTLNAMMSCFTPAFWSETSDRLSMNSARIAVFPKQFMNGVSACQGSPEAGEWEPVRPDAISWDDRPIHWLICFEAFSPAAWIMSAISPGAIVVIVANDWWTYPIPVEIMRQKAAQSMARLWNNTAVFANSGQSVGVYEYRAPPSPNQG